MWHQSKKNFKTCLINKNKKILWKNKNKKNRKKKIKKKIFQMKNIKIKITIFV